MTFSVVLRVTPEAVALMVTSCIRDDADVATMKNPWAELAGTV
jgi:hypothetical protein